MTIDDVDEHLVQSFGAATQRIDIPHPSFSRLLVFEGVLGRGVQLFATAGVSSVQLKQAEQQNIRQELVFACRAGPTPMDVASLLGTVVDEVVGRKRAVERGEVFGPAGPLFAGSSLSALFATVPVFFPEGAAVIPGVPPIVFVWMLPLSSDEARVARDLGADSFVSRLEMMSSHVDLFDLSRRGVAVQ